VSEGFASPDCHVIVSPTAEVIDVPDRFSAGVDRTTERGRAFLGLADDHLDAAYRLARAILRDSGEAQDATHDAFIQAWRKWSTLRDPSRFEPWFDRILVNACRNRLRRASRWQATDISTEVAIATGDPIGQANDRELIGAALATLSAEHRVVVALRYYRDLSIDQIALRLEIPAGTVQSRLHYALERLHLAIERPHPRGAIR
jgi:RNA polymerase sigma-70 factor (ECF subfamily)